MLLSAFVLFLRELYEQNGSNVFNTHYVDNLILEQKLCTI